MGWQYALTVGDEPWGRGDGIDGLFEGAPEVVLRRLAVRGAVAGRLVDVGTRKMRRGDAELTLLLPSGESAGTYELTGFLPTSVRMSPGTPGLVDLTIRAYCHAIEEGAGAVWELVRNGRLDRPGLWRSYGRRAWLSVALNRRVRGPAGVLDGRGVVDVDAFYCALGEAVNGPGGYFGWNLDALVDCLRGGWGTPPAALRWQESAVARERVPEFEDVVSILRDGGVDVRLL